MPPKQRQIKMQQQSGQNSREGAKGDALQKLLASLQEMKSGEGEQGAADKPGNGEPGGTVAMQSFTEVPSTSPGELEPSTSTAQQHSERDFGTTETPFGKEPTEAGKEASKGAVKGRLGEGETLQQMMPTAGDSSRSNRRYKELYEAMAPAAQDAVVQENIPLGSRFLIKRCFESIRPAE